MKLAYLMIPAAIALSACNDTKKEQTADAIEEQSAGQADAIRNEGNAVADNMDQKADAVEDGMVPSQTPEATSDNLEIEADKTRAMSEANADAVEAKGQEKADRVRDPK